MIEEIKDKWKALEARKRAELESALEDEEVADPVSAILIPLAISSAISAASYVVSRALAPKPPTSTTRQAYWLAATTEF